MAIVEKIRDEMTVNELKDFLEGLPGDAYVGFQTTKAGPTLRLCEICAYDKDRMYAYQEWGQEDYRYHMHEISDGKL